MSQLKSSTEGFGGRARSGTLWMAGAFGMGQLLRLASNILLAALLFEEAFALMAIVAAVMTGLGMFSNIGLETSVVQNANGDEPDFLNTVWTLQVIRGILLFLFGLMLAWPVASFYSSNSDAANELLFLIPIVAFSSVFSGFQSAKVLAARRHLRIKELAKLEFVIAPFNAIVMGLLAWMLGSVYALAIAGLLSNMLYTVLSYSMLKGEASRFRWHKESVRSIVSFGKWIFVSTLVTFLALQADRLALPRFFPMAEVGVYSIAASIAIIVPSIAGQLQWSILFPWYSRMLEQGMPLATAFDRTRTASMVVSTYLCSLLFAGSGSFFELAYDSRYEMGSILLPILVFGAWFGCLDNMYSSAFVASGRPKWTALTSTAKVGSFVILLIPVSAYNLSLVVAACFLAASDVLRWLVCHFLGRRLGLRNASAEFGMFVFFLTVSMLGWWLVEHAPIVSVFHPFWRLAVLGTAITLLFAPLFLRFMLPLLRQR